MIEENQMPEQSPLTENMEQALKEKAVEIHSELDALYEELQSGDYLNRAYAEDSTVQISGTLFSKMSNYISSQRVGLNTILELAHYQSRTVNGLMLASDTMTLDLMKVHKENVDKGNTISMEELEQEDAKKIIVPTKVEKKNKGKKA